jgi:hypothetical protein
VQPLDLGDICLKVSRRIDLFALEDEQHLVAATQAIGRPQGLLLTKFGEVKGSELHANARIRAQPRLVIETSLAAGGCASLTCRAVHRHVLISPDAPQP